MDHNSLTVCGVLNGPDLCRAILCFCERIEWVSSGGETKFEGCVSMSEDRTSLSLLSLECSCLMAFFFFFLSLSSMKSWSMQPGSQHPNIWLTIWVECWGLQKRVSVWTLKWYLCLEQDCQGYRNAKRVMGCDILLDTFFFFPLLISRCWVPSGSTFYCETLWFYTWFAKRNPWEVRSFFSKPNL